MFVCSPEVDGTLTNLLLFERLASLLHLLFRYCLQTLFFFLYLLQFLPVVFMFYEHFLNVASDSDVSYLLPFGSTAAARRDCVEQTI